MMVVKYASEKREKKEKKKKEKKESGNTSFLHIQTASLSATRGTV